MKVKPMLGDFEIPHVAAIRSAERRAFAELPVPGRAGSVFQDLDATPLCLVIEGSLYGDEARDGFLDKVRGKFRAGEPVTFVADILTATEVQYVIVEELRCQESGNHPDQIDYFLVLRESPPPPPPPNPLGGLDAGLLDQAAGFLDSVTGALDAISELADLALSGLPSFGDPTEPVRGALDGVKAATSGIEGLTTDLKGLLG